MIDERPQVLIAVGNLFLVIASIVVTGHQGHVLQVAFATLFANRAVVGVRDHQALNDIGAEGSCLLILYGNNRTVASRRHAGHHQRAVFVVGVQILLHRTLAAGTDGSHAGMPAKIRQVEALGQALLQQIVIGIYFVAHPVNNNFRHHSLQLLNSSSAARS